MTFDREQAERLIRECEENEFVRHLQPLVRAVAEQLRAACERVAALEDRLCIDPGGSDEIDALNMALDFAKHDRNTAIAERDAARAELARVMPVYEAAVAWKKIADDPGAPTWKYTMALDAAIDAAEGRPDCNVNQFSSRACEHGTRGCVVKHATATKERAE